ncbi:hypothetical protein ACJX0J_020995, partial [Zea mays]
MQFFLILVGVLLIGLRFEVYTLLHSILYVRLPQVIYVCSHLLTHVWHFLHPQFLSQQAPSSFDKKIIIDLCYYISGLSGLLHRFQIYSSERWFASTNKELPTFLFYCFLVKRNC